MAKQMAYTDPITGTVYPESYWRPTQVNLSFGEERGHILFQGYANQAARVDGKAPIPGAAKSYDVFDANVFTTHFADDTSTENCRQAAYRLAMETLDTDGASFFANATDV